MDYRSTGSDSNPLFHVNEVSVVNPLFPSVNCESSDSTSVFHEPDYLDSDTEEDHRIQIMVASTALDIHTSPICLNIGKKVYLLKKASINDENSQSNPLAHKYNYPYLDSDSDSDSDSEQDLYLISDRMNFTDRHKFSPETKIINASLISSTAQIYLEKNIQAYKDFKLKNFSKRRILILIHGFTVKYEDALKTLRNVADKVGDRYDAVIGYLYPACAKAREYRQAKKNGLHAAEKRLPKILCSIRSVAERVDIVAHSMGTIVAMHALNQKASPKIDNLFLLGGALEEKSIFECDGQGCTTLKRALSNAKKIYVLYSCNDKVLPWLHVINSTQPLGRLSKNIQQKPIAKNVCLINTSSVVQGHSAYFQSHEVFKFFKLIIYYDAYSASMVGTSFFLTRKEVTSSEPIVCSKGINNAITGGFSKKFVAFKFGRKKASSKD
ncbi:alpha/beta hydrolase [Candidatus Protochlamydia sp. R18]|uniref:alpha/beta hydrolase n=1 Tax=Candidatus Protochlamydia sp. R18 TaxID=1353977 RepID=UPI0005A76B64|nr:alpha/beta hydrolase [Candidatus Protochlamydia sp. R18]